MFGHRRTGSGSGAAAFKELTKRDAQIRMATELEKLMRTLPDGLREVGALSGHSQQGRPQGDGCSLRTQPAGPATGGRVLSPDTASRAGHRGRVLSPDTGSRAGHRGTGALSGHSQQGRPQGTGALSGHRQQGRPQGDGCSLRTQPAGPATGGRVLSPDIASRAGHRGLCAGIQYSACRSGSGLSGWTQDTVIRRLTEAGPARVYS